MIRLETTLLNRQRKVPVDRASLAGFLARRVERVPPGGADSWSVCLVSDRRIRELNREFRARDCATDVLSFNIDESKDARSVFGEIYVSTMTAKKQAAQYGASISEELLRLVCHGLLHLFGYDHIIKKQAQEMKERENYFLTAVSV